MRSLLCLVCVACSSSPQQISPPAFHFAVTTTTQGSATLTCDNAPSGIALMGGSLQAFCDHDEVGTNGATTIGQVDIAGFHGADTYTFEGSNDPLAGSVSFDLNGYSFSSVPASPGITATSCSVTITSPDAPQRGDAISGTFHCDDLLGFLIVGDGGYHAQPTTSVDGTFDGAETL